MKRQLTTRLAWFRPRAPAPADPLDDTAALIDQLRARYDIVVVDDRQAHAFVWQHDRQPYDLPVYELANTTAAQFIWPYLLRYPGLLIVRARSLQECRAASLRRQGRRADYGAELAFGGRPLLRAPLLASRLIVVAAAAHAQALRDEYPEAAARVRIAPAAVPRVASRPPGRTAGGAAIRFGVLSWDRMDAIDRALQRARDAGANVEMLVGDPADVIPDADAILALTWSTADEWPTPALAGMAAGRPTVVLETEATADWPALDPQTWRPRDPLGSAAPVVVSIDPRDEEHSLVLAIRRLASSPALRTELGAAGAAWWESHAAPARAADAWAALIEEAIGLPAPSLPGTWPAHLRADGSHTARDVLVHIGVETDIFL